MQEINGTQRDLGALLARVDRLENKTERMDEKLDRIQSTLDQARGGWRVALGTAGLIGAAASFATTFGLKVLGK